MPRYSEKRGVTLLTTEECAKFFGKDARTVKRALKGSGVYVERHQEARPGTRGVKTVNYIDPLTLPYKPQNVPLKNVPLKLTEGHLRRDIEVTEGHAERVRVEREKSTTTLHGAEVTEGHALVVPLKLDGNLDEARSRLELLRPILALSKGQRGAAVRDLARKLRYSARRVYRWLGAFERSGIKGLGKHIRRDKGRLRIPPDTLQLITQALISNTPSTSARMVHRTLMRAVPEVMAYTSRRGQARQVSVSTILRVRQRLTDDPHTRLLFYDADQRKEHLRVYAGEVFAGHANELWQIDMTRCDVMVCDPETGKIFRPRIHAVIDVYSGCIPGWAFALEEDQTQTDLALLRALVPKPPPYSDAWPVWGTPGRVYWDNGKTYSSEQARRVLADLGIEVIYSKPRVSHTRGKIERFFGTFHGYEKTHPGYVGTDAKDRASEELKRLTANTERWLERGMAHDPGWGNRLQTLAEYQQACMDWLLGEYHPWIVHGKSRLDHFLETVPPRTQALYSREELMLVLARRTTRMVNPDGSIRLHNRYWTVESGELINYANREVMVLTNQFGAGAEHLIAWREPSGALRVIGAAMAMPERADSDEARAHRIRSKTSAQQAQRQARTIKGELTNPNTVVSKVLREHVQAELEIAPLPPVAHPTARLAAVNPPDPREQLDMNDEFTRFILAPPDYGTDDPIEIIKRAKERRKGVNRG